MYDNPTPIRRPLLPPRARSQHHEAPRSGQPLRVRLEKRGRCRWRGALTDFARLNALQPWEIFALQERLEESGQATLDAQNAPDEASTLHYESETDATR
jgi:hypothetical protein